MESSGNDTVQPAQEIRREKCLAGSTWLCFRKQVNLLWQNSMALIVMGNAYGIPVSEGPKIAEPHL